MSSTLSSDADADPADGGAGVEGEVRVDLGSLALRVPIAVRPGSTTAVLGPNGSGKTTLLRAVAGLQPLDSGHLTVQGRLVDRAALDRSNNSGGGDVFVPPEQRRIGLVPQQHLLFPHLDAADNVAFGLRCRGLRRRAARARAVDLLERVGLAELARAEPGELSGGQAQRVALARALAVEPAVLLLDEPLAALDASVRPATRRDLRRWLEDFGGATVLVTHDPLDAFALADDVIVLDHGSVSQHGPLPEVTSRPRSPYVAELVGTNLLLGNADGHVVHVGAATVRVAEAAHGEVFLTLAPAAVALASHRPGGQAPGGSPRNHWPLRVVSVEPMGERVRVGLTGELQLAAEVTPGSVDDLQLAPGSEVYATVKATEVVAYPR